MVVVEAYICLSHSIGEGNVKHAIETVAGYERLHLARP